MGLQIHPSEFLVKLLEVNDSALNKKATRKSLITPDCSYLVASIKY